MRTSIFILTALGALLISATGAQAVKIADISRIAGQRTNQLQGWGLVVGLRGTGDGGEFLPAIRPLAQMLTKMADPATVRELADAQNVALVIISVTIPSNGVRNGDKLDAYVSTVGSASSLNGGRLVISPLLGPTGNLTSEGLPFALASGRVILENAAVPTSGVIKGGAVMEEDLPTQFIDAKGRFTLVLEDSAASWTTASRIAQIINGGVGDGDKQLAWALDPKNILVTIPKEEQPDSFISRVQQLPISPTLLQNEARVVINESTGTLTLTGDVEISPVVISHKGLTIATTNPPPTPTPLNPLTTERTTVKIEIARTG